MEGGLSAVNPDDVANIQILKDAASTAVYGSRGANGVILITTKRGESTKPTVTINASTTIAQIQHKIELMNTAQLLEYYKDKNLNPKIFVTRQTKIKTISLSTRISTLTGDAIFRMPFSRNTICLSLEEVKICVTESGEYFDQEGILICTGMKRFAFRSNFDIELNKWGKSNCSTVHIYQSEKMNKRRWRRIKQRNPNCNLHVSLFPGQTS